MENTANDRISPKVIGAIIAAGLMSFCGVAVETATNIVFPALSQQFQVSTGTVQWMTSIYLLTVAIIVPLSAIFKKNFRTKSLFLVANLAFIIGLAVDGILSYAVPSFSVLLIGRVIQGVGTGIALPLMFNIILSEVPRDKIGTMMGVGALITAIAPAVGPIFGGAVSDALSWHFIFIFLLPLLIISLIMGLISIPKEAHHQPFKIDSLSIAWIVITFIGLVFGFSNLTGNVPVAVVSIVIGLVAACLLFRRSDRIQTPIIHLNIMKDLNFTGHTVAFFALQLLTLGFSFILPNYIQIVNGKSATKAALFCLPGAVIGAVFAPFGGRLLDNFGPRKPLLTGSSLLVIALFLFICTGEHLANWMVLCFYFIYMIGVGLSFGNIMTDGLARLSIHRQADGNAVFNTLMQLSGAVSTAIVSAIVAHAEMAGGASSPFLWSAGAEHALIFMFILALVEAVSVFKVAKDNH
ncbi:MAG: MFS transporter [Acetilactobacillus jinshanensis]